MFTEGSSLFLKYYLSFLEKPKKLVACKVLLVDDVARSEF